MARTTDFSSVRSAGTTPRARQADADANDSLDSTTSSSASKPRGHSYSDDMKMKHVSIFGAGIAIGALIGAGAALLFAPHSGEETRELIGERARGFGSRVGDRIDDARGDLSYYMKRGRRKFRRGAERGRWAGQDLADRARKGW